MTIFQMFVSLTICHAFVTRFSLTDSSQALRFFVKYRPNLKTLDSSEESNYSDFPL